MARYAVQVLAPAALPTPEAFFPFGKKRPNMMFLPLLGHFWCSMVTFVIFSIWLDKF